MALSTKRIFKSMPSLAKSRCHLPKTLAGVWLRHHHPCVRSKPKPRQWANGNAQLRVCQNTAFAQWQYGGQLWASDWCHTEAVWAFWIAWRIDCRVQIFRPCAQAPVLCNTTVVQRWVAHGVLEQVWAAQNPAFVLWPNHLGIDDVVATALKHAKQVYGYSFMFFAKLGISAS